MKRKLKGVLGVALVVVLLASLTVGLSAPAGAAPGTLKFSTLSLPKVGVDGDYWAYPDSDVGAIAISPDGDTLFAAVYDGTDPGDLMKSTDGGYSWKMMDDFRDVAEADEDPDTPIVDVAVSPDYAEDLTVFVATESYVYQSVDGGKMFIKMNAEWDPETVDITDLDVSLDERGRLAIIVGTSTGSGGGDVYVLSVATAMAWKAQSVGTNYDVLACAFSPFFADDEGVSAVVTIVDVTDESVGTGVQQTTFTATLTNTPIVAGSVSVTDTVETFTDDGLGVLTGDATGSGTIDYATGDLSVTFNAAPADAASIYADYDYEVPVTGKSVGTTDETGALAGTLTNFPVVLNSVTMTDGTNTFTDDGAGTLTGTPAGAGTITYTTGAFTITGGATNQPVTADYDYEVPVTGESVGTGVQQIQFTATLANTPIVVSSIEVTDGVETFTDVAGDGLLIGDATGSGTIDYATGALSVTFNAAPADAAPITADYNCNGTRVRFSFANTAEGGGWGDDIADAPITDAKGYDYSSSDASIAFPDDFDPWGIGNNVCFVGTELKDSANPVEADKAVAGDVYKIVLKEAGTSSAIDLDIRGVITTLLPTETDIVSIDVCGDAEDASIIVGTDVCDLTSTLVSPPEQFLVYYSTDSGGTWAPAAKAPTGGIPDGDLKFDVALTQVLMSPDFLTDGIAYAATSGLGTSAFSRTTDSGATWNQISLVDYGDVDDGYVIKDLDAAGYNAEGTLHMTTWEDVGTNGAVWKKTGKNWERIWSYANPGVTSDIKELIINGDETMFAVDYTAEKIWRSSDNGVTWPKKITTKSDLKEVCIVSPTTIYTGHAGGDLYWSTKSGTAWTKPDDNPNKGDIGGISVKGDYVLVGNDADGKVYFSSDGGETFARVGVTDPGLPGSAIVSYDLGFAENNIIYCVISFGPGDARDRIYRTELDIDDPGASEWVSIDDIAGSDPQESVVYLGPALALPPSGVLYAFDGAAVNEPGATALTGGLWRCTNPTSDVDSPVPPYFERENKGLDEGDMIGLLDLDVFPTAIFCANLAAANYYEQVVMFTDTLDSGVSLASPAVGAAGVGTLYEGQWKADVILAWEGMTGATKYQYQIAIDKDFLSVLPNSGFTSGQVASLSLNPNTTYYWRVRVANETTAITEVPSYIIGAPLISPWSEVRSFKTVIGPTVARPSLEAPAAGEIDIALSPTFEWSGIEWADKYEFELATSPGTTAGGYFTDVLVGLTGANALVSTAWKCDIDLDYNSRYYWHVKAIGVDTETPWSDVGTFVTMAVPAEPVEPVTPVVIPPVEEITPAWIWVIIGIGAALIIAVVVLVVTTRRVP